jgi:hypothetical protein
LIIFQPREWADPADATAIRLHLDPPNLFLCSGERDCRALRSAASVEG